MANPSSACTDPQVGDFVAKGKTTRKVVKREGGDIMYETNKGKIRSCWISTWQEWCKQADYATTKGQVQNG